MRRSVLILGTDHRYQQRDPDFNETQHEEFASYIQAVAKENHVAALVEENNIQAVGEAGIVESTIKTIARNLGLNHLYCDPDRETRRMLGILDENQIRLLASFQKTSKSDIERQINESMRAREHYWLKQIQCFDTWPVLFICGANHALPFFDLLKSTEFDVNILAEDWCN